MYFLGFVLLVDVSRAYSEHTSSPQVYELLSLASTLFVSQSRSWPKMGASCARRLLSYNRHVQLTAIVGTSRSDHS